MRINSKPGHVGVSLIELMVALAIASFLILGLVQVFAASRAAYLLSEGMARVQENGRFAMDFIQRDIRMAGHFGCVNDQAHLLNTPSGLDTTFGAAPESGLNFLASIQGYEAVGTAPGGALTLSGTYATGGTNFSPSLPAQLAAATTNRISGSDIIALRYLAPEGVPVELIGGSAAEPEFRFSPARWEVLRSGIENPGLFGVADCMASTVFQATSVDPASGSVVAGVGAPANVSGFGRLFTAGQTTLHRAESIVYYVGLNAAGNPALYRLQFTAQPGGALTSTQQELVEGVENLQLIYGQDRVIDPTRPPTGFIDRQLVASGGSLGASIDNWRRVGSVQVALVAVSPNPAVSAQASETGALLMPGGVAYSPPDDSRYRTVYQSTIALRNRLYGN